MVWKRREVALVCDKSADALKARQACSSQRACYFRPSRSPAAPDVDAMAVITPVWTHFELAKAALENGKHVFLEKPLTSTPARRRS